MCLLAACQCWDTAKEGCPLGIAGLLIPEIVHAATEPILAHVLVPEIQPVEIWNKHGQSPANKKNINTRGIDNLHVCPTTLTASPSILCVQERLVSLIAFSMESLHEPLAMASLLSMALNPTREHMPEGLGILRRE